MVQAGSGPKQADDPSRPKRGFVRKISALIATVGVMAAVTACTGPSTYTGCAIYDSGDSSSVIDAPGEFGSDPQTDFPTPIISYASEAEEVIAGSGERLTAGQPARVELSIFNGTTGEAIQSTEHNGQGIISMVGESTLPAVGTALECAKVGSRLVLAASAQDAHNSTEIPQINVAADDSFVFVIDVLDAYPAKANGAPQLPKPGDPAVVLAPNGAPGITIPKSGSSSADAPQELVVSLLKSGNGATLEAGDQAVLHYTGVLWDNNEVFDSSWANGSAVAFELSEGKLIDGFLQSMVGQQVGSQVLVVIPPELGYGDAGSGAVPAGATLVFVVDVLGLIG